jgi:enoyl-CoA hydratase
MPDEDIELRKEESIAVITFKPDEAKGQDPVFINSRFDDICAEISSDPKMRVVVITGVGDDLLGSGAPAINGQTGGGGICVPSIVECTAGFDIPVLIGMHGYVAGPGLELAMACDIRIATAPSQFAFPQVSMGFIPFEGGTQRLPRIVGAAKALEMILTGEKIDAQTGYRLGLVNRIVNPDELSSAIMTMAQEMAASSVISLMYTKEAVLKGMELTLEQGLRLEADLYFLMHSTDDRQEGIRAFREKRKPKFKGS